VRGNADCEIVDAYDQEHLDPDAEGEPPRRAAAFAAARISRAQRDFLAGFAATVGLDVDGLGPTIFCHGSPRSDSEIITSVTRLRSGFGRSSAGLSRLSLSADTHTASSIATSTAGAW
jgi:hypothetical protein